MHRLAISAVILATTMTPTLAAQSYNPAPSLRPQYAMDRGAWSIGGVAGTDRTHFDDGGHIFQFYVSPSGEYFVAPGVALRAITGLTHVTDGSSAYTDLTGGIGVRYYFRRGVRKLYPFAGLNAEHIWVVGDPTQLGQPPLSGERILQMEGGASVMLTKDIAFSGEAYYEGVIFHFTDSLPDESATQYGTAFGFDLFFFQ